MKKIKHLVIVESPTKAKTLGKILGKEFSVTSSMGHLIDLPKKDLGVDVDNDFAPHYVVIFGRKKMVTALKKEAKGKDIIYVATDPDREGEAIGWHLKDKVFKDKAFKDKKVLRVYFHEFTPAAVKEAFSKPRDFDLNMIEAQVSRRIMDRIVGYFLSPLLWRKIARGLSAGRVQSVVLRLIIEREKEIKKFIPKEYWQIEAQLKKNIPHAHAFTARLDKVKGEKHEVKTQAEARRIVEDIDKKEIRVLDVKAAEKKRNPLPPFITSTLQQDAFNKLRFNANRTMQIAQQLYEGIDIDKSGPVGLITYMRTDSTRVSAEAIKEVRGLITQRFGNDYLPEKPNLYKVKKHAQEAHEAIRPTFLLRPPETLTTLLTPEQYKLYELIYNRFIASQMNPARYSVVSAQISAGEYLFVASGSTLVFEGFTAVYGKDKDDQEGKKVPPLEKDEILHLVKLIPSQHFTKAPPRYSDSSLVKALEEDGVGRPSTYAPIIYTLIRRDYARRIKGYFHPTELGFKVCEMLIEYFPKVMDIKFTAFMEEELDEIEEGNLKRAKVLQDFYLPFKANLDFAQENIKKEVIESDETCETCGKPMIVKWGRKGKFLSCSDYPTCKFSKSITSGVKCPEAECGGELIERRSRRGFFFGCSNFPKCRFTSRDLPQDQ
ncbi:type I DNA topoisomerase [Candidatus Omnitrophota bacterium]